MRSIRSSVLCPDYGETTTIAPEMAVERVPRMGLVASDPTGMTRLAAEPRSGRIAFPEIRSHRLAGVSVCQGHVIYDSQFVYTDNSILAMGAKTEAKVEQVGATYLARVEASESSGLPTCEVTSPVILTCNEGSGTWGHWVVHNFPRIAAALRLHPHAKIMIPASYMGTWPSFGDLLRLYGVPDTSLLPCRSEVVYRIEEAILVDFLHTGTAIHPACLPIFDTIAARLEASAAADTVRKIAVQRTTNRKREIVNNDVIEACLAAGGFSLRRLGSESLASQVEAWRTATDVCSVLGSDLTNIVFGHEGMSVVAITPSWFHDLFFFDLAAARGITWNELFCGTLVEQRTPIHTSSFSIDERVVTSFMNAYSGRS